LSTGNYNEVTARIYTDVGFLTCKPVYGYEATALFNYLTGYSMQSAWEKIVISPVSMRRSLLDLIQREAARHSSERPGRIVAKMNALVDAQIIRALYRASQAGVRVELLVRGICCLKPGVPGLSERIRVRSVVGRFLEHSRIFYFRNGGEEELYLSSADWMPRNLNRRVETLFAIEEKDLQERLISILELQWKDTVKARELRADGSYVPVPPAEGEPPVNSQEEFLRIARRPYVEPKDDHAEDDWAPVAGRKAESASKEKTEGVTEMPVTRRRIGHWPLDFIPGGGGDPFEP
jgi:polyphosphate kinase